MTWLIIIAFAYLLNAVATTTDKFLLSKKISNPAIYAFFIGALSVLGVIIAPFGFKLGYPLWLVLLDLVSGLIFAFAYLYMFKALSKNEASRITPFMGGWQPIFVLILASVFLDERLSILGLLAFLVILAGTWLISRQKTTAKTRAGYFLAIIATLLFAISYTLSKYLFTSQDFITVFVWARIGTFLGALLFLLPGRNRRDIKKEVTQPQKKAGSLFIFGQVCGALSFILVNYVISISSSVAIVNALRGLEYVFLLIIILALSKKFPKILEEKMTPKILTQKIIAIVLIITGLVLIYL
ncbi:MAG: GRP family sugar transporter [Patescibacteria group bacterium]